MTGLPLRIASATVAIALILLVYYVGERNGLALLSALAVLRVIFEYGRLHFPDFVDRVAFFAVSTIALYFMHFEFWLNPLTVLFAIFTLTLFLFYRARTQRVTVEQLYFQFLAKGFGIVYCVWLPIFAMQILYWGDDIFWFVFFLALVFIGDTAAYLFGMKFGKTRLVEMISPKKSLEGSLAALVATTLTSLAVGWYLSESLVAFLILGVVISLLAQTGDLVESLMKRASHVKDSGQIMPGHGGLMDRLDGVYWSAPFFYWFVSHLLIKAPH
ncbi:MAG: phosphatidate cytidylyltransferase [Bdellovibrionales bacterium]